MGGDGGGNDELINLTRYKVKLDSAKWCDIHRKIRTFVTHHMLRCLDTRSKMMFVEDVNKPRRNPLKFLNLDRKFTYSFPTKAISRQGNYAKSSLKLRLQRALHVK